MPSMVYSPSGKASPGASCNYFSTVKFTLTQGNHSCRASLDRREVGHGRLSPEPDRSTIRDAEGQPCVIGGLPFAVPLCSLSRVRKRRVPARNTSCRYGTRSDSLGNIWYTIALRAPVIRESSLCTFFAADMRGPGPPKKTE